MIKSLHLLVDRKNLYITKIGEQSLKCSTGEAILAVERFGLTANNITYALVGEESNYWKFFPAPSPWGNVPVWGIANVVESLNDQIKVGERFFGYMPMATHFVVLPKEINKLGFEDNSKHRLGLTEIYNKYDSAKSYGTEEVNTKLLLLPLFATALMIEDFLVEHDFFDAKCIVITSASSKTSLSLAFELTQRLDVKLKIIGVTSSNNVRFVGNLGYYDEVVSYGEIKKLDGEEPSVLIDMTGNSDIVERIHLIYKNKLKYSCRVGATHWNKVSRVSYKLPGPRPKAFFAPTQIDKHKREWGHEKLMQIIDAKWKDFYEQSRRWLQITEVRGANEMQKKYLELLKGGMLPEEGVVIFPNDKS